jgi:hypothetical protein
MLEILKSLMPGDILYTTSKGVNYVFQKLSPENGVIYSINAESKILPFNTISTALSDIQIGVTIDINWYKEYNLEEYESRPCNLSVLKSLMGRFG